MEIWIYGYMEMKFCAESLILLVSNVLIDRIIINCKLFKLSFPNIGVGFSTFSQFGQVARVSMSLSSPLFFIIQNNLIYERMN